MFSVGILGGVVPVCCQKKLNKKAKCGDQLEVIRLLDRWQLNCGAVSRPVDGKPHQQLREMKNNNEKRC